MPRNCARPGCKDEATSAPPRFEGAACPKCGASHESTCPRCGYFEVKAIDGHPKLLKCQDCGDVFRDKPGAAKRELEAAPWAELPEEVQKKIPRHLVGIRR